MWGFKMKLNGGPQKNGECPEPVREDIHASLMHGVGLLLCGELLWPSGFH